MSTLSEKSYIKVAFAPDVSGRDRMIYRFFELIPGVITWGTLSGIVIVSYFAPVFSAFFIITFDVYWLVKTVFLSVHLRANVVRMKENIAVDWGERLGRLHWEHVWHVIVLPMSSESYTVVKDCIDGIASTPWPKDRMIVVLSYEERLRENGKEVEERVRRDFGGIFPHFITTEHPMGREGEIPGKGANESWGMRTVKEYVDERHIPYKDIIVSSFDIDTKVYSQYFEILTWHFLTAKNPTHASYQPIPIFHNNIWEAPSFSRVVATSGTFWQMMQQERPERLTTFSSHSMSMQTLVDLDFWQTNMVSEDSRIFWNALLLYDGDYESIPLSYPVSMDANVASTFWQTAKNVYKQQRRWAWGAENFPYMAFGFVKNKKIKFRTKLYYMFNALEGYWSWSTNALMIFALGWLPVMIGGRAFNESVLSYNLPIVTRTIMTFAMVGLVTSAIVSMQLLPPRPPQYSKWKTLTMVLQWIMVPITIVIFGSFPAIDAQTRLMLGKYMGFWITPKHRKE
jgi:hypothetical protein